MGLGIFVVHGFGLAEDPAIPIWLMLMGSIGGVGIFAGGWCLYHAFGGRGPGEEYSNDLD
jgi:hypothetical protein